MKNEEGVIKEYIYVKLAFKVGNIIILIGGNI